MVPKNKSHILELSDGSDDDIATGDEPEDGSRSETVPEKPEESAEEELKRLSKEWNSPIYVFFKPTPDIVYIKGRRVHVFECSAKCCMGKGNGRMVRQYLDTGDAKSTGNLRKHAKICWGEEAVTAADNTKDVRAAREVPSKLKSVDSSITAAFERIAKDKVTYSHRQHTTAETRQVTSLRRVCDVKNPSNQNITVPKLFAGSQKISDHSKSLTIMGFSH